jgi:hypothetical protein
MLQHSKPMEILELFLAHAMDEAEIQTHGSAP